MLDSFELIEKIEMIYNKTHLSKKIINPTKKNIILIIIPLIIWAVSILIMVIFSIMNKCIYFQIGATLIMVVFMILARFGYKRSLKMQYKINTNDNGKLFYTAFRNDILQNGISKELLIKAKNILEIETEEEQDYSSTHFDQYVSIIVIPLISMFFIDHIKDNYQVMAYVLIATISFYALMSLVMRAFKYKLNNKKAILKKIERIIIEI